MAAPTMMIAALLIGIVAGSRSMMAPAIAAWAVGRGWLAPVEGWPAFMAHAWVRWSLTVLAAAELVVDQLPTTPSRLMPPLFAARIISGALVGATFGATGGSWIAGLIAGIAGAVIGTVGGARLRRFLARGFADDHPAAFIEDALAIGIGFGAVLLAMR